MTIGDPVLRTGKPLSVELGPGMLAVMRQTTLFVADTPLLGLMGNIYVGPYAILS